MWQSVYKCHVFIFIIKLILLSNATHVFICITVSEYICVKCWYLGMDFLEFCTEYEAVSVLLLSLSDIQMLSIMTLGPFDEYLINTGDFKADGNLICDECNLGFVKIHRYRSVQ